MRNFAIVVAAVAASVAGGAAFACGVCIEDRVAATYDHAVIERATAKRQQVVFVALDGPRAVGAGKRLAAAASKVTGVDAKTLRTSASPAAFSFAIARTQAPEHAVAAFRDALHDSGVQLTLVRIVRDGKLIEPN